MRCGLSGQRPDRRCTWLPFSSLKMMPKRRARLRTNCACTVTPSTPRRMGRTAWSAPCANRSMRSRWTGCCPASMVWPSWRGCAPPASSRRC
jgi:hypothetical protein